MTRPLDFFMGKTICDFPDCGKTAVNTISFTKSKTMIFDKTMEENFSYTNDTIVALEMCHNHDVDIEQANGITTVSWICKCSEHSS